MQVTFTQVPPLAPQYCHDLLLYSSPYSMNTFPKILSPGYEPNWEGVTFY